LDYSAALELATLGRKAKECGRQLTVLGGGICGGRPVSGGCCGEVFPFFIEKTGRVFWLWKMYF